MTEEELRIKEETEAQKAKDIEEIALLKERAKTLGLTFNNNLGLPKLKKLVEDALAGVNKPKDKDTTGSNINTENKASTKKEMIKQTGKQVRITLESNDAKDREANGVLICVSNDFIEYKKFIPFGVAWHVPRMILDYITEQTFQKFKKKKVINNNIPSVTTEAYYAKKYTIDILPPLTKAELEALADDQRRTDRV